MKHIRIGDIFEIAMKPLVTKVARQPLCGPFAGGLKILLVKIASIKCLHRIRSRREAGGGNGFGEEFVLGEGEAGLNAATVTVVTAREEGVHLWPNYDQYQIPLSEHLFLDLHK